MQRLPVRSIFDLIVFPTRYTYDPKDVILIFSEDGKEEEKPLLRFGEPMFHETDLKPWIDAGKLFYRSREVHERESE